eukprot:Colp12_sorted_trinity150504_noHs@8586
MPPKPAPSPTKKPAPAASKPAAGAASPKTTASTSKTSPAKPAAVGLKTAPKVAAATSPTLKKAAPSPLAPAKGKATAPGKGAPAAKGGKTPTKTAETKNGGDPKTAKAATVIQKYARRHLAKKRLFDLKAEKARIDEEIENLRKQAWLDMIMQERKEREEQQRKEDEARWKRIEEEKQRKQFLEACFDGEAAKVRALLDKGVKVDTTDNNGNTGLSEAAAGGDVETIKVLISAGAEVNSLGHFKRTPLYRAAFGGHLDAVTVLLEAGGDPRLVDAESNTASLATSVAAIKEAIASWDIARTDVLLVKLAQEREKRLEAERQRKEAEVKKADSEVAEAERENTIRQQLLCKAYEELNKRIFEHDVVRDEGKEELAALTLQQVKDAEVEVEKLRKDAELAKERLAQAKLRAREKRGEEEVQEEELPGVKCNLRELDDVLIRDVGNRMADDGRWPLIVDVSKQSATFLRYRDTNYIQCLNPRDMEHDNIRRALIGAIRYGKPIVVDMREIDMWDELKRRFDQIQPNLLADVMSKKILKDRAYLKLVRKEDGKEYEDLKFFQDIVDRFK